MFFTHTQNYYLLSHLFRKRLRLKIWKDAFQDKEIILKQGFPFSAFWIPRPKKTENVTGINEVSLPVLGFKTLSTVSTASCVACSGLQMSLVPHATKMQGQQPICSTHTCHWNSELWRELGKRNVHFNVIPNSFISIRPQGKQHKKYLNTFFAKIASGLFPAKSENQLWIALWDRAVTSQ